MTERCCYGAVSANSWTQVQCHGGITVYECCSFILHCVVLRAKCENPSLMAKIKLQLYIILKSLT